MLCGLSQKLKTNRWLGGLHQWLKAGRGTSDDDLMVGWINYRVRRITYLLIRSSSTIFCSMTCASGVKYTFKMSDTLVLWRLMPLWQRTKTSHLTSACCPDRERLQVAFACVSNTRQQSQVFICSTVVETWHLGRDAQRRHTLSLSTGCWSSRCWRVNGFPSVFIQAVLQHHFSLCWVWKLNQNVPTSICYNTATSLSCSSLPFQCVFIKWHQKVTTHKKKKNQYIFYNKNTAFDVDTGFENTVLLRRLCQMDIYNCFSTLKRSALAYAQSVFSHPESSEGLLPGEMLDYLDTCRWVRMCLILQPKFWKIWTTCWSS